MRIIHTTDLSKEGNDCYIYKSVSLIEEFSMYTTLTAEKYVGWSDRKDIYVKYNPTCDYDKAKFEYKRAGGKL